MNRVRHGWIEKTFIATEAEVLAAVAGHFGGSVPAEVDALIAGASASAIDAVQGVPALGKLWGVRGDRRKAHGIVRVLALHAVSTWLTSDDGVPVEGDAGQLRLQWARDILKVFEMESDLNLDQFRLRDLQSTYEEDRRGLSDVSMYLLLSDMLRALGDTTRGPLVQAPSIPLAHADDLVISQSFSQRVTGDDIRTLRQISDQNRAVCRDTYHGAAPDSRPVDESFADDDEQSSIPDFDDDDDEPLPAGASEGLATHVALAGTSEDAPAPALEDVEGPPEEPSELDEDEDELEIEEEQDAPAPTLDAYVFAEDGVGIVAVFDDAVPEWRDLGLARGTLEGPSGMPLRLTVNLSLRTALDSLEDDLRDRFSELEEGAFAESSTTALIPLEFEYLKPLACPRCGHADGLSQLQQEPLEEDYHPNPDGWPHGSPAGDRFTLGCPQCDLMFEVVFWFWE